MFATPSRLPSGQRWLSGLFLCAACWPCLSSGGGLKVGRPNPLRNESLKVSTSQGWSHVARRTAEAQYACLDHDDLCGDLTRNFGNKFEEENCRDSLEELCCVCGGGNQTTNASRCENITAVLSSQRDVESFGALGCTKLKDLIIIGGVFDISLLGSIVAVRRYFYVVRTNNLSDISSGSLKFVGGDLRIKENTKLQKVDGPASLSKIEGFLDISDNPALKEIAGFHGLRSIDNLQVSSNIRLVRFQGFANLLVVNEELTISKNLALATLGSFQSLKRTMNLQVEDMAELDSLNAFGALESTGSLVLSNCPKIWSLTGLSRLQTVLVFLGIKEMPLKLVGGLTTLQNLGAVHWDSPSPSCFTHQDLAGLRDLIQFPTWSHMPEPSFEPWFQYGCDSEALTCARGQVCKLDLDVDEGDVVFLSQGRCKGIPNKYATNITRSNQQNVELDYFTTQDSPQPGNYSVCVFSSNLSTTGPMSTLSVSGPASVDVYDCIRGLSCGFFIGGVNLYEGDKIWVLTTGGTCQDADALPDNHSLVRNSSGGYQFRNLSVVGELLADSPRELCWRADPGKGSFIRVGRMSFAGPYLQGLHKVPMGNIHYVNFAHGSSPSRNDSLWIFQKCGVGEPQVKCTQNDADANFSCELKLSLNPGVYKLCWCQPHGDFCNRAEDFVAVAGELEILCPEGMEPKLKIDSPCYKCPAGRAKEKGMDTCTRCQPGRANPHLGQSSCGLCTEPRSYASSGAERCSQCKPWKKSNDARDGCTLDLRNIIATICGILFLTGLLTLLLAHTGKYWLIQEVALSHERLLVTMPHPHGLCSSISAISSFQVKLQGTGWSLLDQPNVAWRASVKNSNTLLLHLTDGQDFKQLVRLGLHADGGWIRLRFPGEFVYSTLHGVRKIVWVALTFASTVFCITFLVMKGYATTGHWLVLSAAPLVAAALACSIRFRRIRRLHAHMMKMAKDREEQNLLEALRLATWDAGANNTSSAMTQLMTELHEKHGWSTKQLETKKQEIQVRQSRNAGVSVAYMLSAEFTKLAQTRTGKDDPSFHDMKDAFFFGPDAIGGNEPCPRDGQPGCSLIDTLPSRHRQEATHFLSWTWMYCLSVLQSGLSSWTTHNSLNPEETFLYMCFFVNNQFRIIVNGTGAGSDNLEAVFEDNLTRIGRAVSLLDTWDGPAYLTRIWTIFEVFKCLTLKIPLEMILPRKAAESLHHEFRRGEVGIIRVVETICKVDSSGAKAWSKDDEEKVKGLIQADSSFAEVDDKVIKALMTWIGDMVEDFMVSLVSDAAVAPSSGCPPGVVL